MITLENDVDFSALANYHAPTRAAVCIRTTLLLMSAVFVRMGYGECVISASNLLGWSGTESNITVAIYYPIIAAVYVRWR
jgi:hypothetical protein